jgi:hypothetical protein
MIRIEEETGSIQEETKHKNSVLRNNSACPQVSRAYKETFIFSLNGNLLSLRKCPFY